MRFVQAPVAAPPIAALRRDAHALLTARLQVRPAAQVVARQGLDLLLHRLRGPQGGIAHPPCLGREGGAEVCREARAGAGQGLHLPEGQERGDHPPHHRLRQRSRPCRHSSRRRGWP